MAGAVAEWFSLCAYKVQFVSTGRHYFDTTFVFFMVCFHTFNWKHVSYDVGKRINLIGSTLPINIDA